MSIPNKDSMLLAFSCLMIASTQLLFFSTVFYSLNIPFSSFQLLVLTGRHTAFHFCFHYQSKMSYTKNGICLALRRTLKAGQKRIERNLSALRFNICCKTKKRFLFQFLQSSITLFMNQELSLLCVMLCCVCNLKGNHKKLLLCSAKIQS